MTRHNLRLHQAFVMLDGLTGKHSIKEITNKLLEIGYLSVKAEDIEAWLINQARETVREHRKSKQRSGDVQHELIHLHEIAEDGTKKDYWKPCGELTTEEAAQHLRFWHKKLKEDTTKFKVYWRFHMQQHGRPLQRLIDFETPWSRVKV